MYSDRVWYDQDTPQPRFEPLGLLVELADGDVPPANPGAVVDIVGDVGVGDVPDDVLNVVVDHDGRRLVPVGFLERVA